VYLLSIILSLIILAHSIPSICDFIITSMYDDNYSIFKSRDVWSAFYWSYLLIIVTWPLIIVSYMIFLFLLIVRIIRRIKCL
jgi:hypothetical protein